MKKSHWPLSVLSTLSAILNALLPVVLVRLLEAEEIGIFKILFLYITLTPTLFGVAGLINGLAFWSGRRDGAAKVQRTGFYVHLIGFVVTFATIPISAWIAGLFGLNETLVLYAIVALAPAMAARYFEEIAVFQGRIILGAVFGSGSEVVRTVAIIWSAWLFPNLETVLLVHCVVSYLKLFVSMGLSLHFGWLRFQLSIQDSYAVWHYAFPVGVAALLATLGAFADQFVLSSFLAPADFALYALGCLALPPLYILEHSITRVLIPDLSQAFEHQDRALVRKSFRRAVQQLSAILVPSVLFLFCFHQEIIELLFTESYAEAGTYLALFAWSYLLLIFPYDSIPRALGRGGWIFRMNAAFTAFTLFTTFAGALLWGPVGALLGALLGRVLMRFYATKSSAKMAGLSLGELIPFRSLGLNFVHSVIASSLSFLLANTAEFSLLVELLLAGSVFSVCYLCLLVVWKPGRRLSSQPESVSMILPAFERGGLEQMVSRLGAELVGRGLHVSCFAFDASEEKEDEGFRKEFEDSGICCDQYYKGDGFRIRAALSMANFIQVEESEVIHTHDLGSLIYGLIARIFVPYKLRHIHTQHSFVHFSKEDKYSRYEKIFTAFVSKTVCVAPAIRDDYLELGVEPELLEVIPNGIPMPEYLSLEERLELRKSLTEVRTREVSDSRLWVVSLARIHPVKGQRELLAIWSKLPETLRARCQLLLVGPATDELLYEELQDFVRQEGLADSVRFTGPTREPFAWLSAADVFVSFSSFEGMPVCPLEALACGTKTLLSDIPGHQFLSDIAILFDLSSEKESLAGLVRELSEAREDCSKSRAARRRTIEAAHSIDRCASAYYRLYFPDVVGRYNRFEFQLRPEQFGIQLG